MEKSRIFYRKTIVLIALPLLFISCGEVQSNSANSSKELNKDSLANHYDEISNHFLQPSEIHRIYKDSALLKTPANVDIRQRLSYSYKKVGDHIKAMEILNKAVEIDTKAGKVHALQYRAWTLLYYYRDYKNAVKDVNQIERMTSNAYNSCWGEPCGFIKGQALYRLGYFKEAIEIFQRVNNEEEKLGFNIEDNHLMYFYIGRCYAEMNEHNKAISFYKKSLTSVKKFPEAYYQIGLSHKKLNNTSLARKNFEFANNYINYSMDEPFIERFDEVFSYMIENELKILE